MNYDVIPNKKYVLHSAELDFCEYFLDICILLTLYVNRYYTQCNLTSVTNFYSNTNQTMKHNLNLNWNILDSEWDEEFVGFIQ